MAKNIASLFSGCVGLDLGFTGGFNFRGQDDPRLDTNIVFANVFYRRFTFAPKLIASEYCLK